jgi:hypothetical protein
MVRHALKHIFQKPTPDIDSSDRTQQLRSKTVYAATVNLAQHLVEGNSNLNKTYTGPYEIVTQAGNSKMIASRSYSDLLSITKGKVLLNQLPLNSNTQAYYQKNFAKGQIYEGNYNQFDPSNNFNNSCNDSVMVYDIGTTGFTGPSSYDANGGFIGATGPTGTSASNKNIFIDPNHCYYSDPCLLDASYTRFVGPVLSGLTGPGQFTAQQIISADQYRGFSYPMSNFNLTCTQPNLNQETGPLFCPLDVPPVPPVPPLIVAVGSIGESGNTIAISQNGITWSGLGHNIFTENGYDVAWNGSNMWVAVGNGTNTIATSINGTDWIPRSTVNTIFTTGFGVAYGSNTWVAVGQGTNTIATSPNGTDWAGLGTIIFSSGGNADVAWNGSNLWVAVGEGTNTIATSPNGTDWAGLGNTILYQGTGVAYGSNLWVAVGDGPNKIVTSPNGTAWTPSSSGNSIFDILCLGVAWNGVLWVAVGNGTTNKIATSVDGMNWTPSSNGNSIFSIGFGVTWNSSLQLWIAVGEGTYTIATSSDGSTWIPRSSVGAIFSRGLGVASN